MKKTFVFFLMPMLFCMAFSIGAYAQALLVEDFDYTVGTTLVSNGWNVTGTSVGNPIQVGDGLVFNGYAGSDIGGAALVVNNYQDVNKGFAPVTSGVIYVAFMFKTGSSNSQGYFLHLSESDTNGACSTSKFSARVFVNGNGTAVGIAQNGTFPSGNTLAVTPGTTYLGVIEHDYATGYSKLYVFDQFPTAQPTSGFVTSATSTPNTAGFVCLRQYNNNQDITVDGIRVATTWAEAVTAANTYQAAPQCKLVVEIGRQYSDWNADFGTPWLEVYEDGEELPSYIYTYSPGEATTNTVILPVTSGMPLRFVWHELDTLYYNTWCTIYSPSGDIIFEKQQFEYLENGDVLNYTSYCDNAGNGGIVYVTPTGTGSGSSWEDALSSIKKATIIALNAKADVWVASGTYYGDTTLTSASAFVMLEGVNVYGGFVGNEPTDYNLALRNFETNTTVLDGQNVRRVLYQPSSFNTRTIWDGFTILNGQISGDGGGVYLRGYGVLAHCVIQNNTANYGGGVYAYYNARVSNCLIANNTATYGGGIYTYYGNIANTTIVRNKATYGSGVYSSYGGITNSIVWGNGVDESNNIYGNANCSYSAVEGGFEGAQIIPLSHFNSPLFVNPSTTSGAGTYISNADWHLQNGSVCINRGDNNALTDSLDLDGISRVKRDTVDLGCYESDFYSSPVLYPNYTNVIYVTQNGSGTQTGEDWANATSSISYALAVAKTAHADVWVAAGTYYGDTSSANAFTMRSGVNVYGGFAGNESANYDLSLRDFETNTTILDGQKVRRVLYQASSFSDTTVWDGFTIQNGYVQNYGNGGGVYLNGKGILSHCIIKNNRAYYGGGVYAYYNSIVSNCLIVNNTATYSGGGVYGYQATISNSTIVRNMANTATGIYGYLGNLNNSIVWGNGGDETKNISGSIQCSYSAVEGGCEGDSIVALSLFNAPKFVNPSSVSGVTDTISNADWHLQQGSVCVNRGNNVLVTDSVDLDGMARIKRDTVDLGCYESDYNKVPIIIPSYTNIVYVKQDGAGVQTGEDWANATSSLSHALTVAKENHADVWVAAGTYYGNTSATNAFTMVEGVNVYGGFAGNEPANYDLSLRDFGTNTTILDGQNTRRVLYQPNSFSDTTVWDGFTIQNGQTTSYANGGGAYLANNGKLSHCVIKNNTAYSGGGVYAVGAEVSNCKIIHNSGTYGGGVEAAQNARVSNCEVTHNNAYYGGGIYAASDAIISNCLVANNTATNTGGGVYNYYAEIINSTIVRNLANSGSGFYSYYGDITNSIVWGNGEDVTKNVSSNVSWSYCAVEGGYSDNHNIVLLDVIQQTPKFVRPSLTSGASDTTANVDWHLQEGSVCINHGTNENVIDSLDLDGTARIKRDTVDLGCYESDYSSSPVIVPIVYVTQNGAGARTGSDWANAMSSIAEAQTMAQTIHGVVWVAAGTYFGDTTSTNAFAMCDRVNVYGSFAGNEPVDYDLSLRDFERNTTILDGRNERRVLYQSGSFNNTTEWDGFMIQNGRTSGYGGGANLSGWGKLSHCIVKNNTAYCAGGVYAYYNSEISNCLIVENTATHSGGGVYAYYGANITNATIVNNKANKGFGIYGSGGNLTNCIVWGNGENGTDNISGDISCSYSAIEGGFATGDHVIILASDNYGPADNKHYPCFVSPDNEDFHLYRKSSLINRGSNAVGIANTDLDNKIRVYNDTVDVGCYEFHGEDYCVSLASFKVQDVTTNAAMLTWQNPDADASAYCELSYKMAGDSTWQTLDSIMTDRYVLTGLQPQTVYEVRVRNVCDADNASPYSEVKRFQTRCSSGFETVTIGETTTTNYGGTIPTYMLYNYTYSQQIYRASEIGRGGHVDTLYFQYYNSVTSTRNVNIYLGHTQKTEFANSNDWVPLSDLTLVYSGNVAFNNAGPDYWFAIPLATAFEYNGSDNIVVAFDDNTGSYSSSGSSFYTHSVSGYYSSMYMYSNGVDYNPASLAGGNGSRCSYRNNIRFSGTCVEDSCARTVFAAVTNVTDNSAQIELAFENGISDFELEYKELESDIYTVLSPTGNTVLLTGLRQNTQYEIRVRTVCNAGYSGWNRKRFTTEVVNYDHIYVTETGTGDGGSWTTATNDFYWALNTARRIRETYGTMTDVWVATGIYYGDTTGQNAFVMLDGVNVYGGFAGNEPANYDLSYRSLEANTTILDGKQARRVLYQPSSFEKQTVWDGFTIQNGQTTGDGGGACLRNKGKLSRCIIKNNIATIGGGVYEDYNSEITNCLIANNTAEYGGGIFSGNAIISSSTIVRNTAYEGSGVYGTTSDAYLTNSIVWGNGEDEIKNISGYVSCFYSAVEGGSVGDQNILLSDHIQQTPKFVRPSLTSGAMDTTSNVDWHLQNGSVCINHGDNYSVYDSLDLNGAARIKRDTVDMGCYESDYYSSPVLNLNYTDIIYVTQNGAGTQTGEDWANATSSLSFASVLARTYNADIWVAAGTYYGDTAATSENAFTMVDGVNVYGGFAGDEPTNYDLSQRDFETNTTILDGQNMRRVLYQPSYFNTLTTWDGFTIQNGYAIESGYGGGAYLDGNGKLSHCVIRNNTADYGGGVCNYNAIVSNCLIANNSAYSYGGGTYISYGTMSNCQISNNTADNGGGVDAGYNSAVSNSLISNNTATSYGGGVYNYYATITNSTIVRNNAANGTGVYGDYQANLTNSIVWGNGTNELNNITGSVTCSYSAVEGGFAGEQNITLSDYLQQIPKFVQPSLTSGASDNTSNVDWHLQQGSVCINRGSNAVVSDSLDLDGTARVKRDTVDMGCYESDFYSSPTVDLNYSNIIYVTQNGSGAQTGVDWTNATSSLSFASAMARAYNAEVWVAAGIYYGDTTSENAFIMVEGVNVYGGFAGNEPADYDLSQRNFEANTTILDGQNARRVLYQPSTFNSRTTWDGFTIQNGYAAGSGNGGGANLNRNGQLSNCVVKNNSAFSGGGIYANNASLSNCVITHNNASYSGGGVYASYNSIVSNCLIVNNTATSNGGGVYNYYATITNSTIVRNNAANGTGVYGDYQANLTNSIVWGNGTNELNNITGSVTCSYSAVEGGFAGEQNIMLSDYLQQIPKFVQPSLTSGASDNTSNVDWHLQQGSVCINRGNNTVVSDGLDLDGTARVKRDTIDMGCYESDFYSSPTVDLNYSNIIYVTQNGSGAQTGEDWNNAASSLSFALVAARTHNAEVWVAAGIYYGDTTSENAFIMVEGVNVYGGFVGNEPADYDLSLRDLEANETILDGQNARRVLYQQYSFNIQTAWHGFTIRNGRAPNSENGGGAYIRSKFILKNCIIQNNYARSGGGVYVNSGAVMNCLVRNNSCLYAGGGIMAYYGATISHCIINNNYGGTIGGVYAYSYSNTYRSLITNCLIANNSGCGYYASYGLCKNTTVVNNSSPNYAGVSGSNLELINGIVWGNQRNQSRTNIEGENLSISYSAIEGGYEGDSIVVLSAENPPLFVNPSLTVGVGDSTSNVDWHLQQGSPCINRGDNSLVTDSLDLDGTARIKRDTVDLGCYESDYYSTETITSVAITVVSNNGNLGSVTGTGFYQVGDAVTLQAIPNPNAVFLRWSDNDTANPRVVIAERDTMFMAIFEYYLPELHVTAISHSNMVGGQQATITWTVQNDGTAPTPNGAVWYDRVWLSVENRVAAGDNNPILLGEFSNVSALAPGESYTQTQTMDIPLSLAGSYYLFVITDAYDAHQIYWDSVVPVPYNPPPYIGALTAHGPGSRVFELSEYPNPNNSWHDNFFYELVDISIPALPDLKVTSVVPATQNFFSGSTVNLTFNVLNDGDYDTRVTDWYDVIFISYHDQFDETAQMLKVIPRTNAVSIPDPDLPPSAPAQRGVRYRGVLLPDSSYQVIASVDVPLDIHGTAYFYVYTDYNNQVYEHVGQFNNVTRSDSVNIILTPPADLVPQNIVADNTVSTGASFHFSYKIYNQGAGAPNYSTWLDRCYLSTNPNSITDAVQIANDWHYNGLPVGESYSVSHTITLPSDISQGTYYLFVHTDAMDNVFEYNLEDNNLLRFTQPITVVQPDLQIPILNVADTLHAGAEASVSYQLANTGDGAVVNRNVTDRFYLSRYSNGANATQLPQFTSNIWLNAHDSTTKYQNVMLPANLQDGSYYLFARTNINNELNEANTDNNQSPIKQVYINHQLLPDLVITSVTAPDTLTAGESTTFTATIANRGERPTALGNLDFLLSAAAAPDDILCTTENVSTESQSLAVGDSTTVTLTIRISPAVTNPASFILTVNPNHTIIESSYSNNGYTFNRVVRPYPFDLAVTDLSSSNQTISGENIPVTWIVQNQGTVPILSLPMYMLINLHVVSIQTSNLSQPWYDRIYLSSDTLLDANDVQIGNYSRYQTLLAGDSYTANLSCRIPVSADGSYYVLVVSDATNVTFDSQRANNVAASPIAVTQSALPDLQMDTLEVSSTLTTGASYQVRYIVSNRGEHITHGNRWTDAIYINNQPSLQGAQRLSHKIHNGQLDTNASYTDLISVTIPNTWIGDGYLIGYTDATDQIFEMNSVTNNMFILPVSVARRLPCDLTVLPPDFPQSANVGENVQISWSLQNIGLNVAQGDIKDAVYLSIDSTWSSDDIMLGSVQYAVSLAANGQEQRSVTFPLQGVPAGDYYVVVRTNILNALNENSYTNNKAVSLMTMHVDYPSLYIDQEEQVQLNSGQLVYYKLEVGPEYEHQTLSCKLTASTPNVSNGLYIAYSSAPSASNFDWSATMPYVQEQEILIPSLNQGTYYIMAKGQTANNAVQSVTLLATIVDFEIISVNANSGTNAGSVTTQIIGAKFDTIMDFRLANSNGYLPAEKVFFHNSTESYATFNLRNQEAGVYDMVAELPGGIITVKGQAFVVEQGLPAELLSNIIAPASVRRGNTFTVTIEYGNNGSTDLNISGFLLVSTNGFPIAFSSDSLANNTTELTFETGEPNGNPDVIRPGHFATKTIFVKATQVGNINLKLYPIRRQY